MVNIKEGVDPISESDKYDVLLVGTNVYGRLSNGWQLDIKLKYPLVHKANLETKYGDVGKMGKIIQVTQQNCPVICLCYITKGYNFRPDIEEDYLSYSSLESCLYAVNILFKGKRIACPILGISKFDGNGDRDKILELFNNTLTDVDVTLYDYEQTSYEHRKKEMIKKIMEAKMLWKEKKDRKPYTELVRKRKEFENKLKSINNLTIFDKE